MTRPLPPAPHFSLLMQRRWNRREWMAAACVIGLPGIRELPAAPTASMPFVGITPDQSAGLMLAKDFRSTVVARWGDTIMPGTPSLDVSRLRDNVLLAAGAVKQQMGQFGAHCDGVVYFPMDSRDSRRGLLCVNHEYVSIEQSFAGLPKNDEEHSRDREAWIQAHPQAVAWMQAAHGVSVLEVRRSRAGWAVDTRSRFARRITANTVCELTGPARNNRLLRTEADPDGSRVLGTFANCAAGRTPWGTYLTAEENIDDYFGGYRTWLDKDPDANQREAHRRWPLRERSAYGWEYADKRFDLHQNANEPFRHGWIVEIDPRQPELPPRKRTALGRFSHEAAATRLAQNGRVAVYMGDDDEFEYVYKFVSHGRYVPGRTVNPSALLDDGTLFVARFDADGTGRWLPLRYDPQGPLNRANGFENQGDVLIKARAAADLLGATPMDRPEDVEPNPVTGKVYIACTKNPNREAASRRAQFMGRVVDLGVDSANPRGANPFGHIIELSERDNDSAATDFRWEILLLGGAQTKNGGEHWLACPDNVGFDPAGRLWVVTDSDKRVNPNNGCFMVGVDGNGRGVLHQLLSAPRAAEVCGCEFTPDGTTLFLSIQHPGEGGSLEKPLSDWPDGGGLPPRSSLIAITRKAGGAI